MEPQPPDASAAPAPEAEWAAPLPLYVPPPTYWPAAMALGITWTFWGVVTSWIVLGVGLGLFTLALVCWIGELRHEHS